MSDEHGHRAGSIGYQAYRNVLDGWQSLRQKHPNVGFITAWAHKSGGPWVTRYLDVVENYYENPGPDDLRFQAWFMQNSHFLPPYKNMAQIWFRFEPATFGLPESLRSHWERFYFEGFRDYEYGLMSALSVGNNVGFFVQFPSFDNEEEKETYLAFIRKWKEWASENIDYLQVRRDLFGTPLRKGGIDGSAHVIGDRGFVFLFNPTKDRKIGSIPLNDLIRLTRGDSFDLKVLFPEEGDSLGTYGYGEEALVDIEGGACKLLEIAPRRGQPVPKVVPGGSEIQHAFR